MNIVKQVKGSGLDHKLDAAGVYVDAEYIEFVCDECQQTQHVLYSNGVIVSGGFSYVGEKALCIDCSINRMASLLADDGGAV